jgi:hypothetical protein
MMLPRRLGGVYSPSERSALLEILINEAGWKPEQIVGRPQQWRVPATSP